MVTSTSVVLIVDGNDVTSLLVVSNTRVVEMVVVEIVDVAIFVVVVVDVEVMESEMDG